MSQAKMVVLVTGGNSGLGFHACLHIAKQDNHHLLLTGRNPERVHEAADKVRAVAAASTIVEEALDSSGYYGDRDAPLNGGVKLPKKETTHDCLEMTFGVNHLGHFYLTTLLIQRLGRIIMITSESHDAAKKSPSPPPNVSDFEKLAFGYEPFNGNEAYATSKLCNALFMFEWLRHFPHGAECISYTPGFTPDTSLLRDMGVDLNMVVSMCKEKGIPINTSETSGTFMGRLAIENWTENGWASGQYIRVHEVYEPSVQAKDPVLASALWGKSTELIKRLMVAK